MVEDQKKFQKKYCEKCDYTTSRNSQWIRHCSTAKHISNFSEDFEDQKVPHDKFICGCGKEYKYHRGLWKHQKTCISDFSSTKNDNEINALTELVLTVVKQNQELSNKIVDMCNNKSSNITNSHINSNNKTFNLNVFLNETCKDAINITDFVNSIQLQISDLEHIGQTGFVEGISNVVNKNLKDLDTKQRPIHCSDMKREVFYIKDDNHWIKEDEPRNKITNIIKQIANKNIKNIPEWVKSNPDCYHSDSKKNDKYLKIVCNSMSGGTEIEQKNNINKIISKLAKEVIIDKNI